VRTHESVLLRGEWGGGEDEVVKIKVEETGSRPFATLLLVPHCFQLRRATFYSLSASLERRGRRTSSSVPSNLLAIALAVMCQ
jgi:hypothetical protein